MSIKSKKLFLLDMDGTLYLGDRLFPDTGSFLRYIRSVGGEYVFLTNNSSKGVEDYVAKMAKLGIETQPSDFLTSVDAAIEHLQTFYPGKLIYAAGTESLCRQLENAGIAVTTRLSDRIDVLLEGFDTELNFGKLKDACILLGRGVDYVATNPDWVCPTEFGYVPDCGSVCEMLYRATGRRPYVVGKPRPDMVALAMKRKGASVEETIVVGDRVYTDIACGINAGVETAFVLSGEGTVDDITPDAVPTYVVSGVGELLSMMKGNVK